ncbi:hypothetical protein KFK09_028259 [Dendrobium nobile]|uniref:Uncharacterized protein n=1 Tax=Dendrobium nobile TaxID=94219 RepID=A0A8T3A212_DENNO|nr:hypothetical protein KFK09_028259 [Dendrobium nobile]
MRLGLPKRFCQHLDTRGHNDLSSTTWYHPGRSANDSCLNEDALIKGLTFAHCLALILSASEAFAIRSAQNKLSPCLRLYLKPPRFHRSGGESRRAGVNLAFGFCEFRESHSSLYHLIRQSALEVQEASSSEVIQQLEQANNCASNNLRKEQAYNNMGSFYVDCDRLDEAAECYIKALAVKHTRAHQGLACVYYLKNQKKAAYDEMTKLIERAKNNASTYEKRSEYCGLDMARSDLNMASKLDPLRTYPYRYSAAGR